VLGTSQAIGDFRVGIWLELQFDDGPILLVEAGEQSL